jgi:hypothetical protein
MPNVDTQKSIPNEARHFLLKLNADDCLNGRPQPRTASDWEGTYFRSTSPRATKYGRTLPLDQREAPVPGDNLLIWINVATGGTGLTANARVSLCEHQGAELRIRVKSVVLLPEPRIDDALLRPGDKTRRPEDVLEDVKFTRTCKLRYLSPSGWLELNAIAGSNSTDLFRQGAEEEVTRRERVGTISSRPAQVDFSNRLRSAYSAKCAVTGCTTQEALEAAHIKVAEGLDDNDLRNGILLRADIHALFDCGLITLTVDGSRIETSPELSDSTYGFLKTARVSQPKDGQPSEVNIRHHRLRFGFPCF